MNNTQENRIMNKWRAIACALALALAAAARRRSAQNAIQSITSSSRRAPRWCASS